MNPGFGGFPPEAMTFFRTLKKHNTREWFQPRKEIYDEKVKGPMLELVAALMRRLADFAPHHVGDPNKAIYRIYRDTRFSKNKTPYKTHIAAVFPRRDLENTAGQATISACRRKRSRSGVASTCHPRKACAIRDHLAEHHDDFRRIAAAREVRAFWERCTETGSPARRRASRRPSAADLLRMKQFLLFKTLDAKLATTPKLYREILSRFEAMTPFLESPNAPFPSKSGRV